MQRIIKFTFILILIFTIGIFYLSLKKDNNYSTVNLVGKKIHNVKLESFEEDKLFTLEDLKKNNFTLINFWASWCAPCRAEHPILMNLNKTQKLKMVGVNFKDKKKNAESFLNDLGNPYDFIARDELGKQSINFGIYGIPETILINKELLIIKKYVGPLNKQDYYKILEIVSNL